MNATGISLGSSTKELIGISPQNQKPDVWKDEPKRYAFSLVFRYSLNGISALQICREASKTFVSCIYTNEWLILLN